MTVGVISDSHGVLRPEVCEKLQGCDYILHAGDIDKLPILEELRDIAPVWAVRGNNDWGRWADSLPRRTGFTLGGVNFFMTHDKFDVPRNLGDTHVVIFGHSHKYFQQEVDGRLWLNPGSCGWPRFGNGLTMAVLHIDNNQVLDVQQIVLET